MQVYFSDSPFFCEFLRNLLQVVCYGLMFDLIELSYGLRELKIKSMNIIGIFHIRHLCLLSYIGA